MKKVSLIMLLLFILTVVTACAESTDNGQNQTTDNNTVTPQVTSAPDNGEGTTDITDIPGNAADNASQTQDKTSISIAALKGPTAIGMVKLMEDAKTGTAANDYTFTIAGTADEVTAGLVKGDIDIAAVPCNLASVLYNNTQGKINLAGINTLGVLYIVETGDTIHTVEDLKGKTIYSTGLGTTPQYTLNYLLKAHGIDPEKDVTIEYKTEATEVAAVLNKTDNAIAMLPQPYVTTVMMSNDKVRIALDVAQEWEAVSTDKSSVVTGVVVVNKDFLTNNKAAFDAFMNEYSESVNYVNNNIDEASTLVEKFDIFKAAPIKKAIPYCNIVLIQGDEMKEKVEGYLSVLFEQNPKAVGGKLPEADFYYMP
jgi:NitT/TauT family transport system substrate-binding protein